MFHTLLQLRLLLGLVPFLGAVLWLGIDGEETYYEKPPSEVKAAIAAADLPLHILGKYVRGSRVTKPDEQTVVTALLDEDGTELMRFVTTVTADGSGSLVDTEVRGPEGRHAKGADEAMKTQAFTMSLMEKLADEHVAAAIEGRPFDMLAFNPMAKQLAVAGGYDQQFSEANAAAMEAVRAERELDGDGLTDIGDNDSGGGIDFGDPGWGDSTRPAQDDQAGNDWGN